MEYAFRVFAAIYNHQVVDDGRHQESKTFLYGGPVPDGSRAVRIPALYKPRPDVEPPPRPSIVRYADEDFCLFHGLDPETNEPDWLAEIFEWLSGGHERGISGRDSVGRVPESQMIFSRAGLLPSKPQAALHMAWLEHALRDSKEASALPKAPSPMPDADHLVVSSHDVDFYFTGRRSAFHRLFKNLAISMLVYKSWGYFHSNLAMILKALRGERVGDYLPGLMSRMEQSACRSTFFVVPVHGHRRDPNYALLKLAPRIQEARGRGFSVELHGSYSSVIENRELAPEVHALEQITGTKILGSRQHWLRFDRQETLFRTVEEAGLVFDSSLGFSGTVGFRNGACFAFPPYDFKQERPHNFLEIPLAIMDGSLVELSLTTGEPAQRLAEQVLNESRKRGWGGISILWHNPLEALSVPDETNQIFWSLLEKQKQFREKWVTTDEFLSLSLPRYHNAGLLRNVKVDSLSSIA
jgi:hypothetical protein